MPDSQAAWRFLEQSDLVASADEIQGALRRLASDVSAALAGAYPLLLVVMGGACQAEWEHTVPKTAKPVGARMSVTIRHSQPAPGERWLREPGSREPGHAW